MKWVLLAASWPPVLCSAPDIDRALTVRRAADCAQNKCPPTPLALQCNNLCHGVFAGQGASQIRGQHKAGGAHGRLSLAHSPAVTGCWQPPSRSMRAPAPRRRARSPPCAAPAALPLQHTPCAPAAYRGWAGLVDHTSRRVASAAGCVTHRHPQARHVCALLPCRPAPPSPLCKPLRRLAPASCSPAPPPSTPLASREWACACGGPAQARAHRRGIAPHTARPAAQPPRQLPSGRPWDLRVGLRRPVGPPAPGKPCPTQITAFLPRPAAVPFAPAAPTPCP